MDDSAPIEVLVKKAASGDQAAWNTIVRKYIPLVFSVIRSYRLTMSDAQDASQALWLRLIEHLSDVRDPNALPGWICVTTRNETLRLLKARNRTTPTDPQNMQDVRTRSEDPEPDDNLLRSERRQMLRDGLAELGPTQREMLLLLVADPPLSYREISQRMGIPVGSIGPTRARCLDKLRATLAMRAYFAIENS